MRDESHVMIVLIGIHENYLHTKMRKELDAAFHVLFSAFFKVADNDYCAVIKRLKRSLRTGVLGTCHRVSGDEIFTYAKRDGLDDLLLGRA